MASAPHRYISRMEGQYDVPQMQKHSALMEEMKSRAPIVSSLSSVAALDVPSLVSPSSQLVVSRRFAEAETPFVSSSSVFSFSVRDLELRALRRNIDWLFGRQTTPLVPGKSLFSQKSFISSITLTGLPDLTNRITTLLPDRVVLSLPPIEPFEGRDGRLGGDIYMNLGGGIYTTIDLIEIPEDSIWRKLAACIPIFGIISTVINELSLKEKINEVKDQASAERLIEVKNHYKIASIIREVLSVAILIAAFALPLLSIGAVIVGAGCVAFNGYSIYQNMQLAQDVKEHGIPSTGINPS